jgi:hypothetical protein
MRFENKRGPKREKKEEDKKHVFFKVGRFIFLLIILFHYSFLFALQR